MIINFTAMSFEEYLVSKKIDSKAFREQAPDQWTAWNAIFEQMHPNSFTAQKLYLINPIRRRFPLAEVVVPSAAAEPAPDATPAKPKPVMAKPAAKVKPVFRPKPKTD